MDSGLAPELRPNPKQTFTVHTGAHHTVNEVQMPGNVTLRQKQYVEVVYRNDNNASTEEILNDQQTLSSIAMGINLSGKDPNKKSPVEVDDTPIGPIPPDLDLAAMRRQDVMNSGNTMIVGGNELELSGNSLQLNGNAMNTNKISMNSSGIMKTLPTMNSPKMTINDIQPVGFLQDLVINTGCFKFDSGANNNPSIGEAPQPIFSKMEEQKKHVESFLANPNSNTILGNSVEQNHMLQKLLGDFHHNNGLQNNGLQNNGLQNNGLQNNGLQDNGLQNNGAQNNSSQNNSSQNNDSQNDSSQNTSSQNTNSNNVSAQMINMQNKNSQNNNLQNNNLQNNNLQNTINKSLSNNILPDCTSQANISQSMLQNITTAVKTFHSGQNSSQDTFPKTDQQKFEPRPPKLARIDQNSSDFNQNSNVERKMSMNSSKILAPFNKTTTSSGLESVLNLQKLHNSTTISKTDTSQKISGPNTLRVSQLPQNFQVHSSQVNYQHHPVLTSSANISHISTLPKLNPSQVHTFQIPTSSTTHLHSINTTESSTIPTSQTTTFSKIPTSQMYTAQQNSTTQLLHHSPTTTCSIDVTGNSRAPSHNYTLNSVPLNTGWFFLECRI